MSRKRQKVKSIQKINIEIIPFAFIASIVPLIVYLHIQKLDPIEAGNWNGNSTYADLLSYCKSVWFIIASSIAFCVFIYKNIRGRFQYKKSYIYVPALIYMFFIVLSAVTSKYSHIALFGFVSRYEGMFVLLFYLIDFLLIFYLIREEKQIKIILVSLLISSAIIGLIGLSQFSGHDFFSTSFGKMLIMPRQYLLSEMSFNFGKMIYSTLSNPNYIGSYVDMLLPISIISFCFVKKHVFKIMVGLLNILLLINLFGSGSSAGYIGLALGILLLLIIFRKSIFKNKITTGGFIIIALVGCSIFGLKMYTDLKNDLSAQSYYLKDIVFEDKSVSIVSKTETLKIQYADTHLSFYDTDNNALSFNAEETDQLKTIVFNDSKYKNYILTLSGDILKIKNSGVQFEFRVGTDTLRVIGVNGDEPNKIEKPDSIDIDGYEKLGSARGYIWSRTIPLLKDAVILGSGPDTFAVKFPQNDYIGKINAYGLLHIIVDKPHNMYLQIAMNTGVFSLLAFLALIGIYIISGIKIYFSRRERDFTTLSGIGVFVSICSYLAAGFFNDSVVSVAPVFWILLGIGFACNDLIRKESNN